jgi:hypothetical protein
VVAGFDAASFDGSLWLICSVREMRTTMTKSLMTTVVARAKSDEFYAC